jgi:hypothetical protein
MAEGVGFEPTGGFLRARLQVAKVTCSKNLSLVRFRVGGKLVWAHARPAAGHSLCIARALEVSRVHARSFSHSDAWDWGKRRAFINL